jgi:hypothetical protein
MNWEYMELVVVYFKFHTGTCILGTEETYEETRPCLRTGIQTREVGTLTTMRCIFGKLLKGRKRKMCSNAEGICRSIDVADMAPFCMQLLT